MSNSYKKILETKGTVVYSDFDLSFKMHPITGDISIKTDVEAINQSVRNLVQTEFGSRAFRPLLGSQVGEKLFELFDDITRNEIAQSIRDVIQNFEPRVDITNIVVSETNDVNEIYVKIEYVFNGIQPVVLNMLLERKR